MRLRRIKKKKYSPCKHRIRWFDGILRLWRTQFVVSLLVFCYAIFLFLYSILYFLCCLAIPCCLCIIQFAWWFRRWGLDATGKKSKKKKQKLSCVFSACCVDLYGRFSPFSAGFVLLLARCKLNAFDGRRGRMHTVHTDDGIRYQKCSTPEKLLQFHCLKDWYEVPLKWYTKLNGLLFSCSSCTFNVYFMKIYILYVYLLLTRCECRRTPQMVKNNTFHGCVYGLSMFEQCVHCAWTWTHGWMHG